MGLNLSDYLLTDDLTILLALIAATVFLLNNLYKPQALVHPILLGRQSDVGRSRQPGESAVYRNYGTGLMGRVSRILYAYPRHRWDGRERISCADVTLIWIVVPVEAEQRCAYSCGFHQAGDGGSSYAVVD